MACCETFRIIKYRPFTYTPSVLQDIIKKSSKVCTQCQSETTAKGICLSCARENSITKNQLDMHEGLFNMGVYELAECTYELYGSELRCQHWYHCDTCYYGRPTLGVCYNCAKKCRDKNHHLEEIKYGPFFCDKGEAKMIGQLGRGPIVECCILL